MNKLTTRDRVRVVAALVEGNSIRATVRMTGVAKNTIAKLLVELGEACREYQDKAMRNLKVKRLQCDEIWSFVQCKDKNVPQDRRGEFGIGDVWTWTGIDADTKLIPCWYVGPRNAEGARVFIDDLAGRIHGTPQITTDGLRVYVSAIRESFGELVDYAQLIKVYGAAEPGTEARYSPSTAIGCESVRIMGEPDPKHISTSYVERANLTMRMGMRRFTRLTNAFSKKLANHEAAIALHFMYYNFARIHQTLKVTPAMAAGVTDHLWEIKDIVSLLDGQAVPQHAS
ncbi:MAG: IS1 family transposase [Phycisphaerae bacterium]